MYEKENWMIVKGILIAIILFMGFSYYRYNTLINQSNKLVAEGQFVEAYGKLSEAEDIVFFADSRVQKSREYVNTQEKYDKIFNDIIIKYKNEKYITVLSKMASIGKAYYRYDELEIMKSNIESKLEVKLGEFKKGLEDYDISKLVYLYNELIKYKPYIDLKIDEVEIGKFKERAVDEFIDQSKKLMKLKKYHEAKEKLKSIESYGPRKNEVTSLVLVCITEIDEIEKEKAREAAENLRRETINEIREKMNYYSNEYGNMKIAVGDIKETNSVSDGYNTYSKRGNGKFVWVYISAKNFGNDIEYVNPNYFTLTSEDGSTVNYDSVSYSFNYLDAIDLNTNNSTSGWLIFYTTKSDIYTLNFNNRYSCAKKQVVD